jgi:hypothetical protein
MYESQTLPLLQLRLVLEPFHQWPRPRPDTEVSFMFEYFASTTGNVLALTSNGFLKLARESGLVALAGERPPAGITLPDQRLLDILVVQTVTKSLGATAGGSKSKHLSYAGLVKMLQEVALLCFKVREMKKRVRDGEANQNEIIPTKVERPEGFVPRARRRRSAIRDSGSGRTTKDLVELTAPVDSAAKICIERMFTELIFKTSFGNTVLEHLKFRTLELVRRSVK